LPRVLLIGDSISIGYTLPVRELLKGKANVHRIPANGGPTESGLASMKAWLGDGKWDVIHFNFGIHDARLHDGAPRSDLATYEKNLDELVKILQATNAKLIWASTTPIPAGGTADKGDPTPTRHHADIAPYNAVAEKVMKQNHVPIDDLYQAILPREAELQLPNNAHYHPEGYKVLAASVAASIEAQLSK
jgi:lysophospholipase L1-like esterase